MSDPVKIVCTQKFYRPVKDAATEVWRPGQQLHGAAGEFALAHGYGEAVKPTADAAAAAAPVQSAPTLATVTIIREDGSKERSTRALRTDGGA